ncbi:MAG: type IX secretion system outer membrane channel protein PorV [Ignavibacteriales bacterium]|nr:type IX secretion system outer membrane channel protein PorV [Ignavibacteriales bacterium]
MRSKISGKKISHIFFISVALIMFASQMFGQGESAVPFLLIAPNARADGMGESGVALSDDGAASYWNPGGLAFEKYQEISITHSNWLPQFHLSDLFYEFLAYRNNIEDWGGTVSGSIIYLNLGEFNRRGENNEDLGTFKAYEFAVTAGYATKVISELGVGVNLRFIYSALDPQKSQNQARGVASTVSFDLGALWKPQSLVLPGLGDIEDRFAVGLNLSNLGPKLTYIQQAQADPLPTNLRLGFAVKIIKSEFNNITGTLDFSRMLVRRYPADTLKDAEGNPVQPLVVTESHVDNLPKSLVSAWGSGGLKKVTIAGGLEYWYGSPKLFALRWGYFYEHPNYGNRKFMTFGAGIRYDIYGFDFSYLSAIEEGHPLSETLRFTLIMSWGGEDEE